MTYPIKNFIWPETKDEINLILKVEEKNWNN